jgi:hypothetical protein
VTSASDVNPESKVSAVHRVRTQRFIPSGGRIRAVATLIVGIATTRDWMGFNHHSKANGWGLSEVQSGVEGSTER